MLILNALQFFCLPPQYYPLCKEQGLIMFTFGTVVRILMILLINKQYLFYMKKVVPGLVQDMESSLHNSSVVFIL